jgi:hypothetical protein
MMFKRKQQTEVFAPAANQAVYTKGAAVGLSLGTLFMSASSHAVIDTAGITAAVGDAATAVGVIGAAVVLVVVGIKVYKWIARSI